MNLNHRSKKSILAFGADGKACFAFARGGDIRLSRDFGSLQDAGNFERYEQAIKKLIRREKPTTLACDLHPGYNSRKLASKIYNLKPNTYNLNPIQHHHAHIASSMFDNALHGKAIGVAFDGTGFGSDGNIWGGEFLLVGPKRFERVAHLDYVSMPGGENAIREPWRMAVAYLYKYYGEKFLKLKIPFTRSIDKTKAQILMTMIKKRLNSPETSSLGRLFDAAGSLVNLTNLARYEGQAPMELEALAKRNLESDCYYKISMVKKDNKILVVTKDLIKGIVKDLKHRMDKDEIALKFHNSLARMILDVSLSLARIYKIKKVVLSGGVFQNKLLLNKTKTIFADSNLSLYTHRDISTTDAGIAAGQAFIANLTRL